MYLTRAYLNPRRRGAIRLLGHPQRMHAAVLAGFPLPGTPGSCGGWTQMSPTVRSCGSSPPTGRT